MSSIHSSLPPESRNPNPSGRMSETRNHNVSIDNYLALGTANDVFGMSVDASQRNSMILVSPEFFNRKYNLFHPQEPPMMPRVNQQFQEQRHGTSTSQATSPKGFETLSSRGDKMPSIQRKIRQRAMKKTVINKRYYVINKYTDYNNSVYKNTFKR